MSDSAITKAFRDAVGELLYHSQMIEWLLRAYLDDLGTVPTGFIPPRGFRLKKHPPKFDKATLGRLIGFYEDHSDVNWLVQKLNDFLDIRNDAAHTAYVWAFVHEEEPEVVAQALIRLLEHIEEAKWIVHALTLESRRAYELKHGPPVSPPPEDEPPPPIKPAA